MNKKNQVNIQGENLILVMSGKQHIYSISKISSRLQKATDTQRQNFTVSASGYGIRWTEIDEDLSIPALLKAKVKPTAKRTSKVKA